VQGATLLFLDSFVRNHKQLVCINGEWSHELTLENGVPQGSILGPLLFLICINDLPSNITALTSLFADDTGFLSISKHLCELEKLVNDSLDEAYAWFNANEFCLNKDKTQNIIFHLRNIEKSFVDEENKSIKFLGIILDSKLIWAAHVDYIVKKLSRVFYLLKRLKDCVDRDFIKIAYFGFFQSLLRYGLILWGNCSSICRVLLIQKMVIREMTNSGYNEHCRPLFITLGIQTVINLYMPLWFT